MEEILFKVDWLAVTIWGDDAAARRFWQNFLEPELGQLVAMGHGGRGYQQVYKALAGAKVYTGPVAMQSQHYHVELTGTTLESVKVETLWEIMLWLQELGERGGRYRITRIDLAWDNVPATPQDFLEAVENDYIRSLVKRNSWSMSVSPNEDLGRNATTVYFGSLSSDRRMRIYDKRGFTRLELQLRGDRAQAVGKALFVEIPKKWKEIAIGHLRDFIEVYQDESKKELAVWWENLVRGIVRANLTVSDAKSIEFVRMQKWLVRQVAPALSVLHDVMGQAALDALLNYGRYSRGDRYEPILQNFRPEPPLRRIQGVLGV